jgi:endo-1,4-beta-D-glucanase Y
MSNQPQAVQAYQLPNGELVTTIEEYNARLSEGVSEKIALAYAVANKDSFGRGQFTRSKNIVKAYLMWKAGQDASGIDVTTAYDGEIAQFLAEEEAAEKAKSSSKKTKTEEAAPATATATAAQSAPEAGAVPPPPA